MSEATRFILALPEPAIELFAEYAGPLSFYVSDEFKRHAEQSAAKIVVRAMRLSLLKTKDAKKYPKIFKRHVLVIVAKSLGIEYVRKGLALEHYRITYLKFREMIIQSFQGIVANNEIVECILANLKRKKLDIAFDDDLLVVAASVRAALEKYKEFLESASIEFIVTHIDENIPAARQ
jgi:2-hydroxychromene-2-carboxylate isomerase